VVKLPKITSNGSKWLILGFSFLFIYGNMILWGNFMGYLRVGMILAISKTMPRGFVVKIVYFVNRI
jgi:hypothetical protein